MPVARLHLLARDLTEPALPPGVARVGLGQPVPDGEPVAVVARNPASATFRKIRAQTNPFAGTTSIWRRMQCRPSNFVLIPNDGEAASADTPRTSWQDSFLSTYRRTQEEKRLARLQEQDKARMRAQKNRARLDRLPEGDQRQVPPYVEYLQREHAQEREAVRERCENRRVFPARELAFTGPLGGLWREGFTISGFASDQHVLFRLMVTRLPGGGGGLCEEDSLSLWHLG